MNREHGTPRGIDEDRRKHLFLFEEKRRCILRCNTYYVNLFLSMRKEEGCMFDSGPYVRHPTP